MLPPLYREISSFPPHVHPEHYLKYANGLFFMGSLTKKKGKTINLKHENCVVVFLFDFFFTYFYKELGAFGHEYEDEG